jgi:metal-dependent amidase/aminoacylase/carboxypeptidase family protein
LSKRFELPDEVALAAYAAAQPWIAWPPFVALSAIVSALQILNRHQMLELDPVVGMMIMPVGAVVMGGGT